MVIVLLIKNDFAFAYKIFIKTQDNLIGQNVIMWGCINGWYRLAYPNQSSGVCASGRVQPIRVTEIGIMRLTHVLWDCFRDCVPKT